MKQIILLLLLLQLNISLFSKNEIDSLFIELDKTIEHKDEYEREKQTYIQNLEQLLNEDDLNLNEQLKITNQLIEAYKPYNFDSTLAYIHQYLRIAKKANNNDLTAQGEINLSQLLASSGRYIEALDALRPVIYNNLNYEFLRGKKLFG